MAVKRIKTDIERLTIKNKMKHKDKKGSELTKDQIEELCLLLLVEHGYILKES